MRLVKECKMKLYGRTLATVILTMIVAAGLTLGSASALPGSVSAAKAKSFKVIGGTVTLTLDPAFTTALSNAGATFSVGGNASTTVNEDTGLTEIVIPVKRNPQNILSLQPWCRCAKIYLDGTFFISGNNASRVGTGPFLQIDSATRGGITAKFNLGGYGDETVGSIEPKALPKSYSGKNIALDLGTMSDLGLGILYKGVVRYAGEPGDGPMPNYNGGPIANVSANLKLQPQR